MYTTRFGIPCIRTADACVGPSEFAKEVAVALQRVCEFFDVERLDSWQNLQLWSDFARFAGVVETAFAWTIACLAS